jgi:hypothetical protein
MNPPSNKPSVKITVEKGRNRPTIADLIEDKTLKEEGAQPEPMKIQPEDLFKDVPYFSAVDYKGEFTDKKDLSDFDVSGYWMTKMPSLIRYGLIASVLLFIISLDKTRIAEFWASTILNLLGQAWGFVWGLVF